MRFTSEWERKRYVDQRTMQINHEISWLNIQLTTKKLSEKNIKEYNHQIKQKEYDLIALSLLTQPK